MPYDRKAFWGSVTPFVLFILFIAVYLVLSVLTVYEKAQAFGDAEFLGRNLWTVTVLILSMVLIWNAIVVVLTIIPRATKSALRLIGAGVTVAGSLIALGYLAFGRPFLGETAGALTWHLQGITQVPVVAITATLNVITAVIAAAVVGALGLLMYEGERVLTADCERSIVRETRLLLYSSAALLVAGVLEIAFLYRWAASIQPSVFQVRSLVAANTFAVKAGAIYSMMLLLIYAPVFALHEQRLARIADAHAGVNREAWLKKRGLQYSLTGILTNLVALASPWLSGLATLLFK